MIVGVGLHGHIYCRKTMFYISKENRKSTWDPTLTDFRNEDFIYLDRAVRK